MYNEIILLIYSGVISISIFGALLLGKEALVALMAACGILLNLFVTKHITLFGFTATAADPLVIAIPLTLNLLQEYHGSQISKRAIWISFYLAFIYMLVSSLHLAYEPSPMDEHQPYFMQLLTPMPRIVIASFTTFLITQFTDWYLYRLFRSYVTGYYGLIANYGSTIVSQAIDTIVFAFLGLYGIMYNLPQIILVSYSIKLATLFCTTPFTVATRYLYVRMYHNQQAHEDR